MEPRQRSRSSSSRLVRLAFAAAAVGVAIGAIYAAAHLEVPERPQLGWARETPLRRRADPRLPVQRIDVPLLRLSRVHVAVAATAGAGGRNDGGTWSRRLPIKVALDTGASLAFGTELARSAFPLRTSAQARSARGFSGARGSLFPLEPGERLSIELGASNAVTTPVEYMTAAALHGAHVIAPPQWLAPVGGAVALDFEHNQLSICESLEACLEGTGYQPLKRDSCGSDPELVGIDLTSAGQVLPMQLDTGAPSLIFRHYFESTDLARALQTREPGDLSGIAGPEPSAELATGAWPVALGANGSIRREASLLWIVGDEDDVGPAPCYPAGSIGTDLLEGCRIVLDERQPYTGFIRCAPAP